MSIADVEEEPIQTTVGALGKMFIEFGNQTVKPYIDELNECREKLNECREMFEAMGDRIDELRRFLKE